MAGIKGRGGQKGRSGRKPGAFTLMRQRIEAEKQDDAEYAFTLYASVMRDEAQTLELRLDCADWIANRVLGKPKERTEHSGNLQTEITLHAIDYRNGLDTLKPE